MEKSIRLRKQKIIILVPSIGIGGQEKMAVLMSEVLKDEYIVKVVAFNHKEKEYDCSVEIEFLNLPSQNGKFGKIKQVIKRVKKFNAIKHEFRPDYVISFGPSANYICAFSNKIGKKIISFRGYAAVENSFALKLSCKFADKIFCISREMCEKIIFMYPSMKKKVFCVYNACDIDGVRKKAKECVKNFEKPTIVSMGRLNPIKGFSHLLKVFSNVLKSIPAASLVIIGGGDEMDKLKEKAVDFGISDRVHFVGEQTNPFPYFASGDICVQTSISEGFMNVIVEAAACGIPVISTDCKAGPREILNRKTSSTILDDIEYAEFGILVPSFVSDDLREPQKEEILTRAILTMLNNEELYNNYKQKANECAERFSLKKYKKSIVEMLNADI